MSNPAKFLRFFISFALLFSFPVSAQTFNPVADTDGQSDVAAGTNTTLNASLWCHLFLKFDLASVSETMISAKLRIYQANNSAAYTLNINKTTTDNWEEGGTHPGTGDVIKSITPPKNAGYKEADITGFVQMKMTGNKIVSLSLTTDLGSWISFYSVQSSVNKPELVIITTTGETYSLNISSANGTVTREPDLLNYSPGDSVKLTANPFGGYEFSSWSGDTVSASNPLSFAIYSDMTISADFTPLAAEPDTLLLDPDATPATVNLWNFLRSVYGEKMLTGCWTESQFGGNSKVVSCSGKTPAIWGQDMNSWYYDRNDPLWNQTWAGNIAGFKKAWKRGQILQVNWHWQMVSSKSGGVYTRDAWGKNKDGVSQMMNDQEWADIVTPGTDLYNALIEDIDYHVVNFLKKIVDDSGAPIPIIFRPLHEIDGGWFWWTCKKDPGKTVQLYKILQDRIINYHHVHNLIWVWNNGIVNTSGTWPPFQAAEYNVRKAFYPGDDFCDFIGIDLYDYDPVNRGSYSNTGKTYRDAWNLMKAISATKMIALCEGEGMPDPAKCFTDPDYAPWLYVLPWYSDTYYESVSQATVSLCEWNNTQFNSPYVINAGVFDISTGIPSPARIEKSALIFPNPWTNGNLKINLSGLTSGNKDYLRISDISGRIILKVQNPEAGTFEIGRSDFRPGLYIVEVNSYDQRKSVKLLVE